MQLVLNITTNNIRRKYNQFFNKIFSGQKNILIKHC